MSGSDEGTGHVHDWDDGGKMNRTLSGPRASNTPPERRERSPSP
jgi:hypothetical protein